MSTFQTEQCEEDQIADVDELSSKEQEGAKQKVNVDIGSAVEKATEELNESDVGKTNLSHISETSETETDQQETEDTPVNNTAESDAKHIDLDESEA